MSEHPNALSRRAFIGGTSALGVIAAIAPSTAFAETAAEKQAEADAVRNQLVGLQADLESASDDYKKALDAQDVAQAAMEQAQTKIDDTRAQIQNYQDKLSTRARGMYRSGSTSFLDFLLGASSFDELTQNWDILTKMNENDGELVAEAKELREELQSAKDEYAHQEQVAADKAAEAKQIYDETQAKVSQANQLIGSLDAEAQAQLADEQAAAARDAAAQTVAPSTDNGGGVSDNPPKYNTGGSVGSYGSVVDYALSRLGCPYAFGAEGPDAFDCSGLVVWAYAQMGRHIGRDTEALYAQAENRVPVSQARPGDVLYRSGHVGIAVGYGGVPYVQAPTFGDYVRDDYPLSWAGFTCALQF